MNKFKEGDIVQGAYSEDTLIILERDKDYGKDRTWYKVWDLEYNSYDFMLIQSVDMNYTKVDLNIEIIKVLYE